MTCLKTGVEIEQPQVWKADEDPAAFADLIEVTMPPCECHLAHSRLLKVDVPRCNVHLAGQASARFIYSIAQIQGYFALCDECVRQWQLSGAVVTEIAGCTTMRRIPKSR